MEFPGLEANFVKVCPHGHSGFCLHGCFVKEDIQNLLLVVENNPRTAIEEINRSIRILEDEAMRMTGDLSAIYREIDMLYETWKKVMDYAVYDIPYDGAK